MLATPPTQRVAHLVMEQDGRQRARQRIAVLEWDEEASSVPEELAGMGVRGRDDGGSGRERIGQRAGRHLLRVPVWGHEHVRGDEPRGKLRVTEVAIHEAHAVGEAEVGSELAEAFAVALA